MINRLIGLRRVTPSQNGVLIQELDEALDGMTRIVSNLPLPGYREVPPLEPVNNYTRIFADLDAILSDDDRQPDLMDQDEAQEETDEEDEEEEEEEGAGDSDFEDEAEEDDDVVLISDDLPICPICQDDDAPLVSGWKMTSCGHKFHPNCIAIAVAFNDKCPLCRQVDPLSARHRSQSS